MSAAGVIRSSETILRPTGGRVPGWLRRPRTVVIRRDEMPKNMKHESMAKDLTARQTQSSLRPSGRKGPGTRIGLFIDWREGSATSGRLSDRYGRSVRDGR